MNKSRSRLHSRRQKDDIKRVPCLRTHNFGVTLHFLLGACEMIQNFLCNKNKCCNYAENVRRHRIKFSRPGDQALRVCAPLTYDMLPFISWYYMSVTGDICASQLIIILMNALDINRRHRSYANALKLR